MLPFHEIPRHPPWTPKNLFISPHHLDCAKVPVSSCLYSSIYTLFPQCLADSPFKYPTVYSRVRHPAPITLVTAILASRFGKFEISYLHLSPSVKEVPVRTPPGHLTFHPFASSREVMPSLIFDPSTPSPPLPPFFSFFPPSPPPSF